MGHLRDVKKLMQESRERKAKEKARQREMHKQERLQQYQELCRQADILIKKAQEEENRKRMEQLQALAEKASQRRLKQATEPTITVSRTSVYHTDKVDKGFNERILYLTRQELQEAQERGEGEIDWELWDKLVKESREAISQIHTQPRVKKEKGERVKPIPLFVYDNKLHLVATYPSIYAASRSLTISRTSIENHIHKGIPHPRGLTFLLHRINED